MKPLLKIILLLLLVTQIYAQEEKPMDTLLALSHSKVDTVRFQAYTDIAWSFRDTNHKEALRYASLLYDEASKKSNKKWMTRANSDMSIVYECMGDVKKATEFAGKAVELARKHNSKKDLAGALLNLSNIKLHNNQIADALELQLEALGLYENLKKNKYIAICSNGIAMSYNSIGKFRTSNSYVKKVLSIDLAKNNFYTQSVAYGIMGDNYRSLNILDSSLFCYSKTKTMCEEIQDFANYATACNNIGQLYRDMKQLDKAEKEYKDALEVSRKIENKEGEAFYEANLADIFREKGEYSQAEKMLLNSLNLSKQIGSVEAEQMAYDYLSKLYTYKNNPDKAIMYCRKYDEMKDSTFSKETARRFSEAQTKFDSEKKDIELQKNKAELIALENGKKVRNFAISFIITLFVAMAMIAYNYYRKKQIQLKAERIAELAVQKDIRSKAIIEAEEKERIRIAKDLHDGVGQLLSAAKLNLSNLENSLQSLSVEQEVAFKNALSLVDDSVKEVRVVSHNMMPNTLLKQGLVSAVREFITKIQNTPNLKVNLEVVGLNERLEPEKESLLYRIIQELVSNIIKHAKASQLTLQIIKHDKELSIFMEDNGIGFDTSKINSFDGIGLKNIISRVEFISGNIHFDSEMNKGTRVIIDVPV